MITVVATSIGKPQRERVIQPDVLPIPKPIREQPPVEIPDHLPDTITLPDKVPA